jgi:hypothetical protein
MKRETEVLKVEVAFFFFSFSFFVFFFLQENGFSVYVRERLAGGVWDTPLLRQFLGYPPVVAALEPPAKKSTGPPKAKTKNLLTYLRKVESGEATRQVMAQLLVELKQVLQVFRRGAAMGPIDAISTVVKQCPPGQVVPHATDLLAQCESLFVSEISGALRDMPIQQTLAPAIETMLGDKKFFQVSRQNFALIF